MENNEVKIMVVIAEKYFFCKNQNCGWHGTWEQLQWKSYDGDWCHQRKTCPRCDGHWFDEKIIDLENKPLQSNTKEYEKNNKTQV